MVQGISEVTFRVRYSEIDRMGTFYNSRALEWFEVGRCEWLRSFALGYAEMEAQGCCLPLIEANVKFVSRAGFDDLLRMRTSAAMTGRASVRFDMEVAHADTGSVVVSGQTIHAVTDQAGKPRRPPQWFVNAVNGAGAVNE